MVPGSKNGKWKNTHFLNPTWKIDKQECHQERHPDPFKRLHATLLKAGNNENVCSQVCRVVEGKVTGACVRDAIDGGDAVSGRGRWKFCIAFGHHDYNDFYNDRQQVVEVTATSVSRPNLETDR